MSVTSHHDTLEETSVQDPDSEVAVDGVLSDGQAPEGRPRSATSFFDLGDITKTLGLEALFVILTFVGMITGLLSDWLGGGDILRWTAYGTAYVFGGWFGVRGSLESLRKFRVDIDLLMILAAIGALVIGAPFEGAMLLFLFSLSDVLQHYAIGRSRSAIRALMKLRPETARVWDGSGWSVKAIEDVSIGDRFLVVPGDRLPLDGVVMRGESSLDQSSLTGESVPVSRRPGDSVFGGTINGGGTLEVRVTKTSSESAIARLIVLVEEAQSEKAETQRLIDRFEQPYVIGVLALTALAIVVPTLLLDEAFDPAFYRAMTLMVASSPCALIISTPAAVLSAIAAAARGGVLFKGGVHVEELATVRAVAFDKTGTLTLGRSQLTDLVVLADQVDEEELLRLAATVQSRSEHHLADAILQTAEEKEIPVAEVRGFQALAGMGVSGKVDERRVFVGNERLFDEYTMEGEERAADVVRELKAKARTVIVIARETNGEDQSHLTVLGVVAFSDRLRSNAAEVIRTLKARGVQHVEMITGDNVEVATVIAAEAGVDSFHAAVLPERKVDLVKQLRKRFGTVAFVGDGVNDAPALAAATTGVAMGGAGTDVALETADLVLMGDDLSRLPYALALSQKTRRTLMANLGFSFGMIALMVGFILTVGLPLPLAVVGHEGSTVLVSLNGLRLLAFHDN
ncbi:MAG: heavy metal translocating P-type ATPase [Rubricoccaceae bacterium]|nr:heavy metal translocating P-type ATPase [Rubricoccaceae bacterium]